MIRADFYGASHEYMTALKNASANVAANLSHVPSRSNQSTNNLIYIKNIEHKSFL